MKMTTRVAFENMKYHKSKNILTGIAIVLTALLLFIVPTVGNGMISAQNEATNRLYPTWHALYRNVDEETAEKLAAHHDIAVYGLRCDMGMMKLEDVSVPMIFMDSAGAEMYKVKLLEGHFPEKENEIVVSEGILKALGQTGGIGDTVRVPYQVYRGGSLDYAQEEEFVICGFLEESDSNREQKTYISMVSINCIKNEIPHEEVVYRFLFQVRDLGSTRTDQIEEIIRNVASQFKIAENDTNVNEDYLAANYVDPAVVPGIAVIMLIIVIAGIITIYSIYYVSMNQRVQEFGRISAIGATRRQIRQIVLREGFCVAVIAIPVGLLLGTIVSKFVLLYFMKYSSMGNDFALAVVEIIRNGEVPIYHLWIYLLVILITLCTVYFSLMKPMQMAAKISQTEAMRYQGSTKKQKISKKGYDDLTIGRLTRRNLSDNRRKTAATIISMAATGTLLMVVATVLSCADPRESADSSIVGQYEISPIIEFGNKEHPEREWSYIGAHNPLTEELKEKIRNLEGVKDVDVFSSVHISNEIFDGDGSEWILGIPESYERELEKGITKGKVTYEELKSGDKVIMDNTLRYWYPKLDIGTKLKVKVYDGTRTYEKEIEIAAIGNYGHGLTKYRYLIMAKEAADALCESDGSEFLHVFADQDYDPALEQSLKELIGTEDNLQMETWKKSYDDWKSAMVMTAGASYAFLGILAVISIMNLINTMINSVHIRKKELGMMQAIGMSDTQLLKMLQMEGLFYTMGTLVVSVGLGSLIGYRAFLYAKDTGMFEIRNYHYPFEATIIISLILLTIQVILAFVISKSVKKEPLIERIRFSE